MTKPDIVIALVGAVGSPLRDLSRAITRRLRTFGYAAQTVTLSNAFDRISDDLSRKVQEILKREEGAYDTLGQEYDRIRRAMAAGTHARTMYGGHQAEKTTKNACMAELAVHAIAEHRRHGTGARCLIVHSLKTPEEVRLLKGIYKERLLVVGLHTPKPERHTRLVERIQRQIGRVPRADEGATHLIGIDERERDTDYGQNIEGTLASCDYFLSASARDSSFEHQVDRLTRLMFSEPFATPSRDESGMVHAYNAALHSASMARRVGASVMSRNGDLLGTGFNEVPKFGGGPYTLESTVDGRDCVRGHDENAIQRQALLQQLVQLADAAGVLREGVSLDDVVNRVNASPQAKDMLARNVTEFAREVHAEAMAISAAARLGRGLEGGTLYSTTFPCHNCAKLIIATGLIEVVFVEPYSKSFAASFYRDSLAIEQPQADKVLVRSFKGVAPHLFQFMFAERQRRDDRDGSSIVQDPGFSMPWFTLGPYISDQEVLRLEKASMDETRGRLNEVFKLDEALELLRGTRPIAHRASEPQRSQRASVPPPGKEGAN